MSGQLTAVSPTTPASVDESEASNIALTATATAAIQWMWNSFGTRSCLLTSMQDAVLVDLAMEVSPHIPVVFLDNGFHFNETLETVAKVEEHYGIKVTVIGPGPNRQFIALPGQCCDLKPQLLEQALANRDAWMSGIQRLQTENRQDAPIVGRDRRDKVKVSPLAQWNQSDREAYIERRSIITNPLLDAGFTSIGCKPCTKPTVDGERSGRWFGTERTECGLHL